MSITNIREQFLPLIEGRLSAGEEIRVREAIYSSESLRTEFSSFCSAHAALDTLRRQEVHCGRDLSSSVLEKIKADSAYSWAYDPLLPFGGVVVALLVLSMTVEAHLLIGLFVVFVSLAAALWGMTMLAVSLLVPVGPEYRPPSRRFLLGTLPFLLAVVALATADLYFQTALLAPVLTASKAVWVRHQHIGVPSVIGWAIVTGSAGLVFGLLQNFIALVLVRCWWRNWQLSRA